MRNRLHVSKYRCNIVRTSLQYKCQYGISCQKEYRQLPGEADRIVRRYLEMNGICLMRYGNIIAVSLARGKRHSHQSYQVVSPSTLLPRSVSVILLYAMRNIACGYHIKTKANRPRDTTWIIITLRYPI